MGAFDVAVVSFFVELVDLFFDGFFICERGAIGVVQDSFGAYFWLYVEVNNFPVLFESFFVVFVDYCSSSCCDYCFVEG